MQGSSPRACDPLISGAPSVGAEHTTTEIQHAVRQRRSQLRSAMTGLFGCCGGGGDRPRRPRQREHRRRRLRHRRQHAPAPSRAPTARADHVLPSPSSGQQGSVTSGAVASSNTADVAGHLHQVLIHPAPAPAENEYLDARETFSVTDGGK